MFKIYVILWLIQIFTKADNECEDPSNYELEIRLLDLTIESSVFDLQEGMSISLNQDSLADLNYFQTDNKICPIKLYRSTIRNRYPESIIEVKCANQTNSNKYVCKEVTIQKQILVRTDQCTTDKLFIWRSFPLNIATTCGLFKHFK